VVKIYATLLDTLVDGVDGVDGVDVEKSQS
jgi:hypothetical protein